MGRSRGSRRRKFRGHHTAFASQVSKELPNPTCLPLNVCKSWKRGSRRSRSRNLCTQRLNGLPRQSRLSSKRSSAKVRRENGRRWRSNHRGHRFRCNHSRGRGRFRRNHSRSRGRFRCNHCRSRNRLRNNCSRGRNRLRSRSRCRDWSDLAGGLLTHIEQRTHRS